MCFNPIPSPRVEERFIWNCHFWKEMRDESFGFQIENGGAVLETENESYDEE